MDARTALLVGLPKDGSRTINLNAWLDVVHSQDRPTLQWLIKELNGGLPRAKTEFRVLLPNGKIRYLQVTAAPLKDGDGQSASHIGTAIDAADKKAAEEERERLLLKLRERVKELRVLHFAGMLLHERPFEPAVLAELVLMLPQGWTYQECCEARITYREFEAVTPGWRETPWRQSAEFVTSGGSGTVEVVYVYERPTADEGSFSTEERVLLNSFVEMLVTYLESDQRDRKQKMLELQLRDSLKMKAMGALAGGIAHDFNNLLAAIQGFSSLLVSDLSDGTEPHFFASRMNVACSRGKEIVEQILSFASSGTQQLDTIGLVTFLIENEPLVAKSLAANTTISVICPETEIPVRANSGQLSQLVTNICKNASEAYNGEPGTVDVKLFVPDEGEIRKIADGHYTGDSRVMGVPVPSQAYGCFRISDHGSGIPPDVFLRIFDPFFSTKGRKGSGLGLSVVHGIIESHGGICLVETAFGKGTTFSVYLPKAEMSIAPRTTPAHEMART